jgi:hypothetical protein
MEIQALFSRCLRASVVPAALLLLCGLGTGWAGVLHMNADIGTLANPSAASYADWPTSPGASLSHSISVSGPSSPYGSYAATVSYSHLGVGMTAGSACGYPGCVDFVSMNGDTGALDSLTYTGVPPLLFPYLKLDFGFDGSFFLNAAPESASTIDLVWQMWVNGDSAIRAEFDPDWTGPVGYVTHDSSALPFDTISSRVITSGGVTYVDISGTVYVPAGSTTYVGMALSGGINCRSVESGTCAAGASFFHSADIGGAGLYSLSGSTFTLIAGTIHSGSGTDYTLPLLRSGSVPEPATGLLLAAGLALGLLKRRFSLN